MTFDIDYHIGFFSKIYIHIIFFTYLLYFLLFFGIVTLNPEYIRYFSSFVQFCVAMFLIIRFNPFRREITLKEGESRIIFSSGIFLLINLGATEIAIHSNDYIQKKLKNIGIVK
jgi:hypothetical protein